MKSILFPLALLTLIAACSSEAYTPGPPAQPLAPLWCPEDANILFSLATPPSPAPYPGTHPPTSFQLCDHADRWTFYRCAICRSAEGNLTLLPGLQRCQQDTARVVPGPLDAAGNVVADVVCVVACTDPDCAI